MAGTRPVYTRLKQYVHRTPVLSIADDGIGLYQDFNMEEIKSFGIKLIKDLTEDLEGDFTVIGQPGTTLLNEFDYKSVLGIHHEAPGSSKLDPKYSA